ncbi:MAG: hypothetical protein CEN91_145 [Candidatus Berkelbacteria bacterium Licking1014_85]|uniref:PsbP C-terminal domain-containing protein n=1 Tax=Candidatus Berkelbacteria bacterium Licking1014_85 TaxID=2017148 RepID=A0A554LLH1_9BACT|nr:MAG: hypothetical protein CEN91_145 [Candidatus Berkelbacteria bacterium Licking1014_85]
MSKLVKIILGIVVVALVGLLGYALGTRQNVTETTATTTALSTSAKTSTISTGSLITTSTTAVDPTADWKTYTNTTYEFSFKYPKDWKLIDLAKTETVNGGFQNGENYIQLYPPTRPKELEKLEVMLIPTNSNLLELIKEDSIYSEINKANINNILWSFGERNGEFGGTDYQAYAVIDKNYPAVTATNKVKITAAGYSLLAQKATLDQILSTFKFTK